MRVQFTAIPASFTVKAGEPKVLDLPMEDGEYVAGVVDDHIILAKHLGQAPELVGTHADQVDVELVERVAEAIYNACRDYAAAWDDQDARIRYDFEYQAKAAIKAMREALSGGGRDDGGV